MGFQGLWGHFHIDENNKLVHFLIPINCIVDEIHGDYKFRNEITWKQNSHKFAKTATSKGNQRNFNHSKSVTNDRWV